MVATSGLEVYHHRGEELVYHHSWLKQHHLYKTDSGGKKDELRQFGAPFISL